jgi:preprotein translocase subunit SecG
MEAVLWLVFVFSAIILVVVVLLQEPKGGGLAEAFGGMGAQTFGVKATGITKFTAYVAVVFILSSVLITCYRMGDSSVGEIFNETETTEKASDEGNLDATPGDTGTEPAKDE